MFRYKYIKQNDAMVYDGDLGSDLISFGVPCRHIDEMKETDVKELPAFELPCRITEYAQLVPLSKVVGFSRGTPGKTVYENVQMTVNGQRDSGRLSDCLSYLQKYDSLQELFYSYEKMDVRPSAYAVHMYHEKKYDEYYVTSNGNHRTLVAKMLGAPYINALVTEVCIDIPKTMRIQKSREIYEKYAISKIKLIRKNAYATSYQVIFKDDGKYFEIIGYEDILSLEDVDDRIDTFSKMLQKDFKQVNKAKSLHPLIRKFFLKMQRSEVRQLFNKNAPARHCLVSPTEIHIFLP